MMTQQIHPGDPAYAPPLIRPPSPASSIGTAYGDDETSDTDDPTVINNIAFDQRVFDSLLIHQPSDAEVKAGADPLLKRPEDPAQEQLLFKQVMENLRGSLRQLEADARFDEALYPLTSLVPSTLPHPPRANEQLTASGSVDDIMRRMMTLPVPSTPPPIASTSHQQPIWPAQPVPLAAPLPLLPNGGVGPSAENFLMASPEVAKTGSATILPMLAGPQGRPLPSPSRPTSPTLVMGLGRPPLSARGAAGKAVASGTTLPMPMPMPMGTGTLASRRISQSQGRAHHEVGNTTRMHQLAPEQRVKNHLGSAGSPTEEIRRKTRSQTAKAAVAGRPKAR